MSVIPFSNLVRCENGIDVTQGSVSFPVGSLTSAMFSTSAEDALDVTKQQHLVTADSTFDLHTGETVATRTGWVYIARTTGTLQAVRAGVHAGHTTGSCTVDLQKNGASVLNSPMSIDVAAGTTIQIGSINSASADFVGGDVFKAVLTNSAGDATGPFLMGWFEEAATGLT